MADIRHDEVGDTPYLARHWCLEIALIFVVFFIAGGAPAPHVNETYYLAKAKHYWQPEWCAGDLYLESADAHATFFWTVGWLTKSFSLSTVAWIGRIAAWWLLAVGWQQLSRRVVARPWYAVLSAMLMVTLINSTNFAGEWVVGGVEGKCFAYACVFAALANIADGHWRRAPLWIGLAAAFHVLVGGWSAIAAAYVWAGEKRDSRPRLTQMLPALVLGGLFALPGVIPALQLTADVPAAIRAEANQIYVFDRLPHHLAPLSLPTPELTGKAIRFAALLLSFALLWRVVRSARPSQTESTTDCEQPLALVRTLRFAAASVALGAVALLWHLVNWNDPARAASLLKFYWFRLADVAVPLAVSLAVVWLITMLNERRSKWAVAVTLFALLLPAGHLLALSVDRYQNPCPPADFRVADYLAWRDACAWIRENTPTDARFLTPRNSQSFKWRAHRAEFVIWKDVPQDARSLVAWQTRYNELFWHADADGQPMAYGSLAKQGTARIRQLAEKYQFDFVVTDEYPPLDLPVAYRNESYAVYSISRRNEVGE